MQLLRSERKRTIGIILFLSFFAVLMFIRISILGSAMSRWGFFVLAILVALEFGFLLVVNHTLNSDGDIPREVLYLVLALESLCPAVGVAFATSSRLLHDYRPWPRPGYWPFFHSSCCPFCGYDRNCACFPE
jgi:hypothetical protein